MKTLPAALDAHYKTGSTTVSMAILIARTDGARYAFTSHDQSFELDISAWGYEDPAVQVFDAKQGLDASAIVSSAGFAVDNMELTTLDDGSLFDRDDVLQGFWQNAEFRIFRYNVNASETAEDVEVLMRGTFGEITLHNDTVRIELRGLAQKLQQLVGIVSTKTCRARLGDELCKVDLAPYTHTYTVTFVGPDAGVFGASGSTARPTDYYGEGLVTFLTGVNKGAKQKVRRFTGGVFTLVLPLVRPISVGDTFTAQAGCRKRLEEDCIGKFNNVLNFQGEPHRPLVDAITRPPEVTS